MGCTIYYINNYHTASLQTLFKETDKKLPHWIVHSKILNKQLTIKTYDIYDYCRNSSSDDETDNDFTNTNQRSYLKKTG